MAPCSLYRGQGIFLFVILGSDYKIMEAVIPIFLFAAIMLATILISALPAVSIRLLETFRIYKKGRLQKDKRNYVDGAGRHVYRTVYLHYDEKGVEKFANLQVFIWLLLLSSILSALVLAIYLITIS